ncbi:hypothetical protein ACLOJK_029439 [Asimina triloba]
MSGNSQLSGSFPDFPRENALRILKLSRTGFSGSLPDSFRNLSHLTQLNLYNNNFNGQIPPLDSSKSIGDHGGLRDLEVLDLGSNSLYGTIPFYLFTLPSLKKLYLDGNQLEGELPEFSNTSSTIEVIYLSHNKLHGRIPISIFGFRRLRRLSLSGFNGSVDFAMLDLSQNSLVVNANYVIWLTSGPLSVRFTNIPNKKLRIKDCWVDTSWNIELLKDLVGDEVMEEVI